MTEQAKALLVGGAARRGSGTPVSRATAGFVPIREPETGKLLFRYDPVRQLIEMVHRKERLLIDLQNIQVLTEKNICDMILNR